MPETLEKSEKKNTHVIWIYIGLLFLVGAFFCYVQLQPAQEGVTFSKDSGFYDKPFYLTIHADGGTKIYYTLDGSEPDETSTEYTSPIYIDDATNHENTISMRTDVSTGFYTELIEQYSPIEAPGYTAPDYLVDKCTVLRVLAVGEDGTKTRYAKSYFVNVERTLQEGYIISLEMDEDSLFDAETGIYVTGNTLRDNLAQIEQSDNRWETWKSNYSQRGREWERKAAVQMLDANGREVINQTVGIRIHGGISRGSIPKGFNLYARKTYDGTDSFSYDLFHTGYYAKRITLEAGGNQIINPISDYLVHSRIENMNVASKHYIPCELYLNGEYWGFYWICEKFDEKYVEYYYGCDSDDVMIVKGDMEGPEEERIYSLYSEVMDYICAHDMSDEACYQKACEMIDINDYIDYNAVMIYIGRMGDWPMGNYAMWRSGNKTDSPYADGRWRWMVYDLNSMSMGYHDADWDYPTLTAILANYVGDYSLESKAFSSLWVNEGFRESFRKKLYEVGETCFQADEIMTFIDQYDNTFRNALQKSWNRYYGMNNKKEEEYLESIDAKKNFFSRRYDILYWWFNEEAYTQWTKEYTFDKYLQAFGLSGEETVTD